LHVGRPRPSQLPLLLPRCSALCRCPMLSRFAPRMAAPLLRYRRLSWAPRVRWMTWPQGRSDSPLSRLPPIGRHDATALACPHLLNRVAPCATRCGVIAPLYLCLGHVRRMLPPSHCLLRLALGGGQRARLLTRPPSLGLSLSLCCLLASRLGRSLWRAGDHAPLPPFLITSPGHLRLIPRAGAWHRNLASSPTRS
jgi:hypothetical protein